MTTKETEKQIEKGSASRTVAPAVAPAIAPAVAPQKVLSKLALALGLPLAVASTLCLAAIGLEAVFALAGLGDEEYVRPDPVYGIAHYERKYVTFKSEGFSRGWFSSKGLRDSEHPLVKPANTTRIAFLGDSKTEGLQVPQEETFVKRLEAKLNAQAEKAGRAKHFETINFATAGYGTLAEYLQYINQVKEYKPDVTVLVYNFGDSGESGESGAVNNTLARPSAKLDKDGKLEISFDALDKWLVSDATSFKEATEWLRRQSRVFQVFTAEDLAMRSDNKFYTKFSDSVVKPVCNFLGKHWRKNHGQSPETCKAIAENRRALLATTRTLDGQISHEAVLPPAPRAPLALSAESQSFQAFAAEYRNNMELTARLLKLLNAACKANGSKLVLVTLPAPDNCTFYFWELRTIKMLGDQCGFQVVDANETFPKLKAMEANPYYYSSHLSPIGHERMTEIMVKGGVANSLENK